MTANQYNAVRRRNLAKRSADCSRRGRLGVSARHRNMLADISREWRIVRVGTWLDPATGDASRWIIRADGDRHVALTVNGRHVCAGAERTIRAALARCMWGAAA